MHADPNHPGLKKFRKARARDKAIAILRNEIWEANPNYNDSQVQEIAKAAYRAQTASRPKVQKGRKHKGKGRRNYRKHEKVLSVQVEVLHNIKK